MDIVTLITNLVGGVVGGNVAGAGLKDKSLGVIGNSIAGLVGGVAGGYILQAVNLLNTMGLGEMTVGSLATSAGISAIAGAVLTAVVGYIKSKMSK